MAKLVSKKTTTTVTEEVELVPTTPGEVKSHRFMRVREYGTYHGANGREKDKPKISLNAKWLADAGFDVGEQIDVEVRENELVVRKLISEKNQ